MQDLTWQAKGKEEEEEEELAVDQALQEEDRNGMQDTWALTISAYSGLHRESERPPSRGGNRTNKGADQLAGWLVTKKGSRRGEKPNGAVKKKIHGARLQREQVKGKGKREKGMEAWNGR